MTNVLVVTCCNRVKQTLLALSLNAQTIKDPFSVIICDSSTQGVPTEEAVGMCAAINPYNKVKESNYCSDVNLLRTAHQYFPNIEEFKVIHESPNIEQQAGDAFLMGLGFMQASLLGPRDDSGSNYVMKVSTASVLRRDIFKELPQLLLNKKFITWNYGPDPEWRSTRVMGGKPEAFVKLMAEAEYNEWTQGCGPYPSSPHFPSEMPHPGAHLEMRYGHLLNKYIDPAQIHAAEGGEPSILVDGGGLSDEDFRRNVEHFIKETNIDTGATPWLQEFTEGGIFPTIEPHKPRLKDYNRV